MPSNPNLPDRRTILKASLGACLACPAFAQSDAASPAAARPKEGDLLVKFGDATNTPLTPSDVPADAKQIFAWSMDPADKTVRSGSRLNRILLVRFDPDKLTGDTKARSAEGVIAYSSICPHNGCDVNEWVAADQTLYCGCHSSKFDPRNAAKVLDGPSPNPLPALPLKVADGKLVVAKPFTARITFEIG